MDGRGRRGVGTDSAPVWAPDGRRIAYVDVPRRGVFRVVSVRPDGTGRKVLVRGARRLRSDPDFSPDGRRPAFTENSRRACSTCATAA
jgi:Tol biopolymer transport system component